MAEICGDASQLSWVPARFPWSAVPALAADLVHIVDKGVAPCPRSFLTLNVASSAHWGI